MHADQRDRSSRTLIIVAVALGLGMAAYGTYLMLVGIPWTSVPAVPPGEPLPEGTVTFVADPAGLIPLLGGLAVVIGLGSRRIWIAWGGAVVVAAFSAAFLFGVGGILSVPAFALLVVLVALTWRYSRSKRSTGITKTVAPPTSTSTG